MTDIIFDFPKSSEVWCLCIVAFFFKTPFILCNNAPMQLEAVEYDTASVAPQ